MCPASSFLCCLFGALLRCCVVGRKVDHERFDFNRAEGRGAQGSDDYVALSREASLPLLLLRRNKYEPFLNHSNIVHSPSRTLIVSKRTKYSKSTILCFIGDAATSFRL